MSFSPPTSIDPKSRFPSVKGTFFVRLGFGQSFLSHGNGTDADGWLWVPNSITHRWTPLRRARPEDLQGVESYETEEYSP